MQWSLALAACAAVPAVQAQAFPSRPVRVVVPFAAGNTIDSALRQVAEGIKVGYLPQEPQLDPDKTVIENVKLGAGPVALMVERFNAITAEMGDPQDDTDFDALMTEMGELQEKIDAADGWALDSQLEQAMEALRCPPGD
eukprot:gene59459-81389_t